MQSFPQHQPASESDRCDNGHRGPLSRTWPQLFKKRRRYSPVRESAQQQHQHPHHHHHHHQVQPHVQVPVQDASKPKPPPPPHQRHRQPPIPIPIHSTCPLKPWPSQSTQSIASPSLSSSARSPSLATDTTSTLSTISQASSGPAPKTPIARRTSATLAPAEINAAGGVLTPQADLLASTSNYELLASGRHLEMGLHFSTAMATGVMMKRATHRAAEQARRDRMKTAMVDLAEFLLDGDVTVGSGTTCFVVMRRGAAAAANDDMPCAPDAPGPEKKTVNKARLIEMALEKMRAQEREIALLRSELRALRLQGGAGEEEEA